MSLPEDNDLVRVIEKLFRQVGAVNVEVNPQGLATHWRTQVEAEAAKAKVIQLVQDTYYKDPQRVEVWQEKNGAWAMFCVW